MKDYEMVVGLEVHAELNTESKIFCDCKNAFGLEVNTQVCPICMGMPGTLPTLNEKVVEYAIKMGHALNCTINNVCRQDRKNYFYPDLPKAYQISQADVPLCEHGSLEFMVDGKMKTVRITRIHIEEDAGKLLHEESFAGSLVDLNRCGVPLIEIVSEPDIRSSAEAKAYLETIKSILQYIGISDCKMQEGSIRCDVNVSVMEKGSDKFGTRSEMKNVNSFSAAVRGIEYEAKRQIELLEKGEKVIQETRRWDDAKGMSFPMRSKEDAQDYRYFPEPDLLTIVVDEEKVQALKESIPELPNAKIKRYVNDLGLSQMDATLIAEDMEKSALFDKCNSLKVCKPKNVSNWILSDISKYVNETGKAISQTNLTAEKLCTLIARIDKGVISNSAGKTVFDEIMKNGGEIDAVIDAKGLAQNSDTDFIENLVKEVFANNEKSINDYKNGKTNALGYLVGQCMKASKGKANPGIVKETVTRMLEN
ncbi:Asp-tRNA(Asn)/Glu-tRNA(Gln) amidotransferase subunit GatB [Porcipelethomonas sp.]|uniref:Asp-tRNA(Asn)/Glu-tRNA(Gln) amidotransferase subunit GatB n=1 Tax=Porcipelethomonas sp. TaxID=2981675 RepID=UPI003EF9FB4C